MHGNKDHDLLLIHVCQSYNCSYVIRLSVAMYHHIKCHRAMQRCVRLSLRLYVETAKYTDARCRTKTFCEIKSKFHKKNRPSSSTDLSTFVEFKSIEIATHLRALYRYHRAANLLFTLSFIA
jgi:hypothetical protein